MKAFAFAALAAMLVSLAGAAPAVADPIATATWDNTKSRGSAELYEDLSGKVQIHYKGIDNSGAGKSVVDSRITVTPIVDLPITVKTFNTYGPTVNYASRSERTFTNYRDAIKYGVGVAKGAGLPKGLEIKVGGGGNAKGGGGNYGAKSGS